MSLAAAIQITDQDVNSQASVAPAELVGQMAVTSDNRWFTLNKAGGALTAGQVTQPAAVTANYANRTLTVAAAQYANQVAVTLGTTALQDAFVGFWLVVNDGVGQGQGTYYIEGNTAATSGNSNSTVLNIRDSLRVALTTGSDVTILPSQSSAVVQHTAAVAVPTSGVPVIDVTSGNYFWSQVRGMASVLSDGAVTKNAQGIPSDAVAGAVEIRVDATVVVPVGYAPELTVDTEYSPFVLTLV